MFMRPLDVHVFYPKRVPGEVYLKYLHDAIKSVLKRGAASIWLLLLIGSSLVIHREECRCKLSMPGKSPPLSNAVCKMAQEVLFP